MASYTLPEPAAVSTLLAMMFGRKVAAKPLEPAADGAAYTGVYRDDAGRICATWTVDAALAATCGAALSMIPPAVAADCARRGELDEVVAANLHEVANVCVGLFNHGDVPRIRLAELVGGPVPVPDDVAAFGAGAPHRVALAVEVAGYPPGHMRLATAG